MGRGELPTGLVTLLLAGIEDCARLWETQPEQMPSALAQLDRVVTGEATAHGGVRAAEQGEGDGFVIAFARASDAVGCALALARTELGPIRLRIGIHTGEVQLREPGTYIGPTLTRALRQRDLAHGGQVLLSAATTDVVIDALPEGCWVTDLGSQRLRGLARPERVAQLCHAELRTTFPPLPAGTTCATHNLPARLTSFVGRRTEINDVCRLVSDHRLVTLTGAGGVGKTRLASAAAAELARAFEDGVFYVDLAPITIAALVPITVARTLGLSDQPGTSTMQLLARCIGRKAMLLVVDNCEHLLGACATLIDEMLRACPQVAVVATSREPLGAPGEVVWRVPTLSLADEAIELFTDRARLARPGFEVNAGDAALVGQICERLDGMPLAIELAAARVRALSLPQIAQGLDDRFRLLTGGARTALPRQQTLRASVDWSYGLLAEPERVLFGRLAVFAGGFDLDAAHAVAAVSESERSELVDHLSMLVDKSLVMADHTSGGAIRYRMLETVRQYAREQLDASDEPHAIGARHREYYRARAAALESVVQSGEQRAIQRIVDWAQLEIDNLWAALAWSRGVGDDQTALELVSALQPFWSMRDRFREGLAAFEAVLTDDCPAEIAPEVWARAVADHGLLASWLAVPACSERAGAALAIARKVDDPELIIRALIGCGAPIVYNAELARPYLAEAADLARAGGLRWGLCLIRAIQSSANSFAGDPLAARMASEEGRQLADAYDDHFLSRLCRLWLSFALWMQGDLAQSVEIARSTAEEAEAAGDLPMTVANQISRGFGLAYHGDADGAHAAARSALAASEGAARIHADAAYAVVGTAALAGGDAAAARQATETSWKHTIPLREVFIRSLSPLAEAALACGDLVAARRWADDTVAVVTGWYLMQALTVRALVATAQGEPAQAERDAYRALSIAAENRGYLRVPDTLECLARLAISAGNHNHAVRLLGAADTMRRHCGQTRFPMYQADYRAAVSMARDVLDQQDYNAAWSEGAALGTHEAIAFATRGRGQRNRAATGWESLTPAELDVVRLVTEGLTNKDIATRLFISPRTVQTHLTHIYAKLNLGNRTQLTKEAAKHT